MKSVSARVFIASIMACAFVPGAGATIIALPDNPTVRVGAFRSFTGAATIADRTVGILPYSESGVTAIKQGNVVAIADYEFFSGADAARLKIDFDFSNVFNGDDSTASVSTVSPHITIQNTAGVDLMFNFFSEIRMTGGTQEATLSHRLRDRDTFQTYFDTGFLNDRYLANGTALTFSETGILPAGQRAELRYSAVLQGRNPLHNAFINQTATAVGTIDLQFSPVPEPAPAVLLVLGLGALGLTQRRRGCR